MAERKVTLTITVSPAFKARLEALAQREDRSVSNLVERLLTPVLDQAEQ